MTIDEYVENKKVQYQELKENFFLEKSFEKKVGEREKACLNCKNELNFRWIPSDSWTSAQYCHACKRLNLVIRPDCMGGYCMDNVEIYQEKL